MSGLRPARPHTEPEWANHDRGSTPVNQNSTGRPSPDTNATVPSRRADFRPDIEGLRALAVMLVVAYHARVPFISGGFVGVDVFFVVSGFLITGLITEEIGRTGKLNLASFYGRRARRLLPAAALTIAVSLAVGALIASPLEQLDFSKSAAAAAFYFSNFWFIRTGGGYFHTNLASNPSLHTWSLAVEEQFYLFWPVLILLVSRSKQRQHRLIALGAVSVVSFVLSMWLMPDYPRWAFFASPPRVWEFGLGGLMSIALQGRTSDDSRIRFAGWAGVAMLFAAAMLFKESTPFPGVAAWLPCVGTLLLLLPASVSKQRTLLGSVLESRPFQYIGRHSYTWYLWHWPVLVFALSWYPNLSLGYRVVAAVLALGLAVITHRVVENPIRHSRRLAASPAKSIGMGLAVSAAAAVLAVGSYALALRQAREPEQRIFTAAARDRGGVASQGCLSRYRDVEPNDCIRGAPSSDRTVVLFGDSHAAQWLPGLAEFARSADIRLVVFVKGGCPAAFVSISSGRKDNEECAEWRRRALDRIGRINPDAVIVSNYQSYVTERNNWKDPFATWEEGNRQLYRKLTGAGLTTIVVRDTPRPFVDIPICLSRAQRRTGSVDGACMIDRKRSVDDRTFEIEKKAASGLAKVHFVDFSDAFCTDTTCSPMVGGLVVYRDDSHITGGFSNSLAPNLAAQILPLLPDR